MNKPELYNRLNEILSPERPFNQWTVPIFRHELQMVVEQLEKQAKFEGEMESEKRIFLRCKSASEGTTKYRQLIAERILKEKGVQLPVNAMVSCRFYNTVADHLGVL